MSYDERTKRALLKAKARGEVAKEWFKTNALTSETITEFNKLMKDTDKKYVDI